MDMKISLKDEKLLQEEQEEEEEALSLCDLPINFIKEETNQPRAENEESQAQAVLKTAEDFDFGSRGGFLSTEPEMCAADEVFFKGQILPLRLSVSSDSGLAALRSESRNPSRSISRSESMDHGSVSRLASLSSRSSSTGSRYSSSTSTSSITSTTKNSNSNFKPIRISNNFHTHPSPKPQIRVSKSRAGNFSSQNKKSSIWEFFRLGLVRQPEIELQDLKARSSNSINNIGNVRSSVSRNSSCSSSNSSSSIKNSNINIVAKNQQDKRRAAGLFSGCTCSVSAVNTVPLNNIVVIKSGKNERKMQGVEEKLQELKIKKKMKEKEKEKQQQGKQALSRHRTFEWLKELSHASYVDDHQTRGS